MPGHTQSYNIREVTHYEKIHGKQREQECPQEKHKHLHRGLELDLPKIAEQKCPTYHLGKKEHLEKGHF
jgi:hypothetical protein